MKSYLERFKEVITSRLFVMLISIIFLFSIVSAKLFTLQIVNGEQYLQDLKASILQELTIPASRGIIYDRYGRPLATNQVAFSLKVDDSIKISFSNKNKVIADLIEKYEDDDLTITDNLPISQTRPYSFTFSTKEEENAWKTSIGLTTKKNLAMTAEEVLEYLYNKFEVQNITSEVEKRKAVSLALTCSDKNLMLLYLLQILNESGETLVDDLPISLTQPYVFLFDGNESKEQSFKKDSISMRGEQLSYNANETMEYLYTLFEIPANLSEQTKRNLVSIRYSLYLMRYRKYQPVTVALNISDNTIAKVEEYNEILPGAMIDTSSIRNYTAGEYFSHIIGYIRKISDTEYAELREYGYTNSDIIGKSGIEKLYELELNGVDGEMKVEVDAAGRRISTIETKQPVSGDNVYLTLDKKLQESAYDYLEEQLTEVLIYKLTATSVKDSPITLKEFFVSLVSCNTLSLNMIMRSTDGQQKIIRDLIENQYPDVSISTEEGKNEISQFVINSINGNAISSRQLILVLIEQGKITANEQYLMQIENGLVTPLSVIITKLREGDLTPGDTNLDPCSGSVVVSDVNTGETLALVTYPSYDNNRLVNNFDNEYYNFLLASPSTPLVNRALRQKKAPGSTFKMITSLAALEENIVTPKTLIQDLGVFTKAGYPYARCLIYTNYGSTHGAIGLDHALEVSCNYYFYEAAYRMGNQTEGTTAEGIATLNKYMSAFGLDTISGIEIGESEPNMATPEYKEQTIKWQNPDATTSQTRWTDGDTIRAAIGQSVNNYAPVHINKYMATLANGGTLYKMHLIDKIEEANGTLISQIDPTIEKETEFKEENLQAVYDGMLLVTQGSKGTARRVFSDFPIAVAAKTGTAQENLSRSSHTWFTGFAPFDNPQIAITVMIPFGEHSISPSSTIAKNIIAEYMGLNYEPENSYMKNNLAK